MNAVALVCVDVQPDFLPGGALAVPDGNAVVAPLVALTDRAELVLASRDWHPAEHCSFAAQGGPWPQHCVAGSAGAALHPRIAAIADIVISKGEDAGREEYSAFDVPACAQELRARGIDTLWVGGLATDYCVKATVLGALAAGFRVVVVTDACRGVDVAAGDSARALDLMAQAGAELVTSAALRARA